MGVLRSWFGPSKDEIWRQLSQEIGAAFVDGGTWGRDKVVAQHGEWTVTLDTYAVSTGKTVIMFTRMRAPYVNKDGFRFTIYRTGWFSELGKSLGMQDVEVGHPEFDKAFVIKGSEEKQLRELFANPKVRELIQSQPTIHLTVKDDEGWFRTAFPQGVDELCFHVVGIIKDLERLKSLYALFGETLDNLCRIGSAYKDDPKVIL